MPPMVLSRAFLIILPMLQRHAVFSSLPWNCTLGSCYHIPDVLLKWSEASCWCRSNGGHLLDIDSAEELDAVRQLMGPDEARYWIGASDLKNEGQFLWEDGVETTGMIPWYGTEPNGLVDQDCAMMIKFIWWETPTRLLDDFYAFDEECFKLRHFVCKEGTMCSRLWKILSRDQIFQRSSILGQFPGVSQVRCGGMCVRACNCLSFAHRELDGDCILYNNHISRLGEPEAAPGYEHYD